MNTQTLYQDYEFFSRLIIFVEDVDDIQVL